MRAFLALEINDQSRSILAKVQNYVRGISCGKGNWSRPENLHLSLAFLGEISADQADVLVRLLKTHAQGHNPFVLSLGHLGFFQDKSCATLWCSVDPSNDLNGLVSDVYTTVRDAGIPFDNKPFKAHITLGRKINLTDIRLSSVAIEPLAFPVNRIVLYKSELRPDGPVYTEWSCVRL